jgi:hypothetical protein
MFFKPQTDPYFQYNFIVRQEPTLNDITLCLLAPYSHLSFLSLLTNEPSKPETEIKRK